MSLNKTKIIFTGSVGAGKTLAIKQLCELSAISTEVKSTESSVLKKTTVAMDYGKLMISKTEKLYLYGTPGQKRFDFMDHILYEGASGLIILIDNSQENPLQDLDYYLNRNARFLMTHPAVIGVTHFDESSSPSLWAYQTHLNERNEYFPVLRIDARVKNDLLLLLHTLINEIVATQYAHDDLYIYA